MGEYYVLGIMAGEVMKGLEEGRIGDLVFR